jgi:UDP-N-acetyl-D-mannosaminuronate dehydrogenase
MKGRRVLLLGLSYKRNTGDARESPSQAIARLLVARGADVLTADPHVGPHAVPTGATLVDADSDEARSADAVVVLVDHDLFDLEAIVSSARYVFDTRRCVYGPNVEHL